uniref:Uncharacterized protein n=1 Tax=Anguilla anguilla TaxID=7936 RepID=A0A0E9UAA0_ANGAN
MTEHKLHTY